MGAIAIIGITVAYILLSIMFCASIWALAFGFGAEKGETYLLEGEEEEYEQIEITGNRI